MPTAIAAIVTQLLASPVVKWGLAFFAVFAFGFVRGCEWKADRVKAAEIRRPVIVQPRRPLFPRLREVTQSAAASVVAVLEGAPKHVPTPDPISTPPAEAVNETEPTTAEIWEKATKPLPKADEPPQACVNGKCGPNVCHSGTQCDRRPTISHACQRRGLFGRLR